MITIKRAVLRSDVFRGAFFKVVAADMDVESATRVLDLAKALESVVIETQKDWVDIAEELIERDEKGNFRTNEEGNDFKWLIGVSPEQGQKIVADFARSEVQVPASKLSPSDLSGVRISAEELAYLSPLVEATATTPLHV